MRTRNRPPLRFLSGRRRAAGYLAGTAPAAIACASSPPASRGPALEEVYTNAPGCAEVAAAHRADPTMEVHVPAQMIGLAVPSDREPGAEAEVRFTVTETGEVDPESIARGTLPRGCTGT